MTDILLPDSLKVGLLAFYPLWQGPPTDEVSGNAAASSTATPGSSPDGPALVFDGASQYISLGSSTPSMDAAGGALTLACYASPDALATNQHLIGGYEASSPYPGYGLAARMSGGTGLAFWCGAANGGWRQSNSGIVDGNWHVYSASQSAANLVKFYRDGVAQGTSAPTGFPAAWSGARALGGRSDGAAGYFLKGGMGWAGIWNRELTAADYQALMLIAATPQYQLDVRVPTWGGFVAFIATSTTVPAGAQWPPLAPISAINATPTIYLNGQPATLGPPTWCSVGQDTAMVTYRLASGDISPGDVLTYDAPANWLTPTLNGAPLGGLRAVTGAPISNFVGRREEAGIGIPGFAFAPKMRAGINLGEQPCSNTASNFTGKNRMRQGGGWGASIAGSQAPQNNGVPVSWASPASNVLRKGFYGPGGANGIDSSSWPNQVGEWVLSYPDSTANTPNASAVAIACDASTKTVSIVPLSITGPNAGTTRAGMPVDPSDVHLSGGKLSTITLANTDLGVGYQGALVTVNGDATVATAVVDPATQKVTGFAVVRSVPYSAPPTVLVYGTRLDGTVVTSLWDVEYNTPTPATWTLNLGVNVAAPANNTGGTDGRAYWTLGGPQDTWAVAPDATTGKAPGPIDRSKPLAADDNALKALTSKSGRTVATIRAMDADEGYGGGSNFCLASDLVDPTAENWQAQAQTVLTATAVRYLNTNPASTTYAYSSTKIYGPQAVYAQNFDPPFALTGTTTAESTQVTGLSTTALMRGSAITGPGIPDGTLIAGISGGVVTLSQPATASGAATLSVTNPGYIALPATDNGWCINNNFGSQGWAVVEIVFADAHNLTAGDEITVTGGTNIPLTNIGNWNPGSSGQLVFATVTGPNTVAVGLWVAGSAPSQAAAQTVASATPVPVSWTITRNIPGNNHGIPYEAHVAMTAELPGCRPWINLPGTGTDALHQEIGRRAGTYAAPGAYCYSEFGNECWNTGFALYLYYSMLDTALGYVPSGQPLLEAAVSTGTPLPTDAYGPVTLLAAHAHDQFAAGWAEAGQDPSRIIRVFGSWWQGPQRTQQLAANFQRWGVKCGAVAVAPYDNTPSDPPILAAFTSAAWPISAINDFIRYQLAYSATRQNRFAAHAGYLQGTGIELISYEGGIQVSIPQTFPLHARLQHDSQAHPSRADLVYGWLISNEIGCQSVPGSGLTLSAYYQLYNSPGSPEWILSPGTGNPPGDGSANLFATAQGGAPADGHDHWGGPAVATGGIPARNVSPGLYGFMQHVDQSSPNFPLEV